MADTTGDSGLTVGRDAPDFLGRPKKSKTKSTLNTKNSNSSKNSNKKETAEGVEEDAKVADFKAAFEEAKCLADKFGKSAGFGEQFSSLLNAFFDAASRGGTLAEVKGISFEILEAIYTIAFNIYKSGEYKDAEELFHYLVGMNHFETRYYLALAACKQQRKQFQEALIVYSSVITLDNKNAKAAYNSALCHLALANISEAKSALIYAANLLKEQPEKNQRMIKKVAQLTLMIERREARTEKSSA